MKKDKKNIVVLLGLILILTLSLFAFNSEQKKYLSKNKKSEMNELIIDQNSESVDKFNQESGNKDIINFNGQEFNLYKKENINNGVAFYFSGDIKEGQTLSQIIINVYDEEIKADKLAESVLEDRKKNANKIFESFVSLDEKSREAFYITSLAIYYPDEPYADIYIMKIFSTDKTYMIIYQESLLGVGEVGLELIADTWLVDNLEKYGSEIDKIDPKNLLFNKEIQENNNETFVEDESLWNDCSCEKEFDNPIPVEWYGEIMTFFLSETDIAFKVFNNLDYKQAYLFTDGNTVGYERGDKINIKGNLVGITCAYTNTIFHECVPNVVVFSMEKNKFSK